MFPLLIAHVMHFGGGHGAKGHAAHAGVPVHLAAGHANAPAHAPLAAVHAHAAPVHLAGGHSGPAHAHAGPLAAHAVHGLHG